ncbi:beta-ketoacyl-[acyl-carrier-protein] synthase family protein [uncultured Amnibacterium sp.]|uniref:beta-ketoacyl-[acyl-carrier-protein] synthase family protein n=1 Tax=uncultured Amnibacterium sp. TaxID=1631851 RepID=UPI0035C9F343
MAAPDIVVTGIGAFSPLGINASDSWTALLAGRSGTRTLEYPWVQELGLSTHFAAQAHAEPAEHLDRIEAKRLDRAAQFALIATREAWADAGSPDVDPARLGVDWATGIGNLWTLLTAWDTLKEKGARRVPPMTVPMLMPNAAAAAIEMEFRARAGARTVVSACASSNEAIGNALDHLRLGYADVIIAGGTEACVHGLPLAAFGQMQALSKRNDAPELASRPYDSGRDGFVLGEGAAALILEREDHAKARGATIYARLLGGAVTSDAFHISAPDPDPGGSVPRTMRLALEDAGLTPEDVSHINAHATSTPVGDIAEYTSMRAVFGSHLDAIPVSATKAATGHLLGAAGAIEAVFTVTALRERIAPPTINLTDPDPEIPLDVVTAPRALPTGEVIALSNSFGFGGHNAVTVFATA